MYSQPTQSPMYPQPAQSPPYAHNMHSMALPQQTRDQHWFQRQQATRSMSESQIEGVPISNTDWAQSHQVPEGHVPLSLEMQSSRMPMGAAVAGPHTAPISRQYVLHSNTVESNSTSTHPSASYGGWYADHRHDVP